MSVTGSAGALVDVAIAVSVTVGSAVGASVSVGSAVGSTVFVDVTVALSVGVFVGERVAVFVGAMVAVASIVDVSVGSTIAVSVGTAVSVAVGRGVAVDAMVGTAVGATVYVAVATGGSGIVPPASGVAKNDFRGEKSVGSPSTPWHAAKSNRAMLARRAERKIWRPVWQSIYIIPCQFLDFLVSQLALLPLQARPGDGEFPIRPLGQGTQVLDHLP